MVLLYHHSLRPLVYQYIEQCEHSFFRRNIPAATSSPLDELPESGDHNKCSQQQKEIDLAKLHQPTEEENVVLEVRTRHNQECSIL